MARKNHEMTEQERYKLEALHRAKMPIQEIARQLGFTRQTIYNELRRGAYLHERDLAPEKRYSAQKGQQVHRYNQTAKGAPLKIGKDRAYADYLEGKMIGRQADGSVNKRKRFSPAAALAAARREGYTTTICISTLYTYIEKGVFLQLTNKDLWEKGKRKKRGYRPVRRIAHPQLPLISDRPAEIENRKEYGHWEMDLIISRAGSQSVLMTLTERKSRREMIFKLEDRKAASIRGTIDRLEKRMGRRIFKENFKSITTDNGPEFLEYEKLKRSIYGGDRFQIYYCHSYAAWEKGTNENHNRMIRRWFPKGTDFAKVKKKDLAELEEWMNNYPRKSLSWSTPSEVSSKS